MCHSVARIGEWCRIEGLQQTKLLKAKGSLRSPSPLNASKFAIWFQGMTFLSTKLGNKDGKSL